MADTQENILVIIADQQAGAALARVLRSADYAVTLLQDGGSAVKQATMLNASLVVLAERLRDGPGLECAAEFARRLPALPLVLLINQDSPELIRRAMRAGIGEVIC